MVSRSALGQLKPGTIQERRETMDEKKSEEIKECLKIIAAMPAGKRYELLNDLAKHGFKIMITLTTDEENNIVESIEFKLKIEK
jgi:hypothetical protein